MKRAHRSELLQIANRLAEIAEEIEMKLIDNGQEVNEPEGDSYLQQEIDV